MKLDMHLKKRVYSFVCLLIVSIALVIIADKFFIQPWKREILERKKILKSGLNRKKIAYGTTYFGQESWYGYGSSGFDKCEFSNCTYVKDLQYADAVLFHSFDITSRNQILKIQRPKNQIWIYKNLESPHLDSYDQALLDGIFNWTITYRSISDIHLPYGYFTKKKTTLPHLPKINLSTKTKLAVIVSSHCGTLPSGRWEYIAELQKHIPIDVFGKCGKTPTCGRDDCVKLFAKEYKFYLSFENAKCKEYLTEKLFLNGYLSDMVPIVLGGYNKQDYENMAPPNSFIYSGDFKNASTLAEYIQSLDRDSSKYLDYFKWRQSYDVFLTDLNPGCKVCKALHDKTLMSENRVVNYLHSLRNKTSECVFSNSTVINSITTIQVYVCSILMIKLGMIVIGIINY